MSRLEDDLARFTILVPYVASEPEGVPLDEVCDLLDLDRDALVGLIARASAIGAPDGAPDELVDLYIEGDRVHVALAQRFERPPRFRVDEMLALLLAIAPLRHGAAPQLSERAAAVGARLLQLASERAGPVAEAVAGQLGAAPTDPEPYLAPLEQAVFERRIVDADYYTASRDALSTRRIAPVALQQHGGIWYVIGNEGKTFKVERFRRVELTAERFEPDPALDLAARARGLFSGGGALAEVTIEHVESGVEWTCPSMGFAIQAAHLRAARGRNAWVAPAEARARFVEDTRALLARYQD